MAVDLCRAQEATSTVHAILRNHHPRGRSSRSTPRFYDGRKKPEPTSSARHRRENRSSTPQCPRPSQRQKQRHRTERGTSLSRDLCQYCSRCHDLGAPITTLLAPPVECARKNHYVVTCREIVLTGGSVMKLADEFESVFVLNSIDFGGIIFTNILVNDQRVRFILDCGSTVT